MRESATTGRAASPRVAVLGLVVLLSPEEELWAAREKAVSGGADDVLARGEREEEEGKE